MDAHSSRCGQCAGPLAHDQRYCLRCGARRGPLPARIGLRIAEIHERGRALPGSGADLPFPPAPAGAPGSGENLVAAARAAAVAILLMIAFGCVVGSLTKPGGVEALARQLVIAVSPTPTPSVPAPVRTAAAPSRRASASANGGGGSTPSSASPTSAAAPAAVPQQTVTVAAPTSPTSPTSATTPSTTTTSPNILGLPPIKHVWEIVLSQQGYDQAFATSAAHPYLARRLRRQGELIADYYGVAQSPLANEIALISGQGPTLQTNAGCPTYSDITPATVARYKQVRGDGCVYPQSAQTLPDQLAAAGLGWRAYVQGIGEKGPSPITSSTTSTTTLGTPAATATSATTTTTTSAGGIPAVAASHACPHPAQGATDPDQSPSAAAPYATWRNPFVYFRSVLIGGKCSSSDVGLDHLAADLKRIGTTPAFSYVSPDPCDDGSDQPCSVGAPSGLTQADRFLKTVVPKIERSPAYKQDGLIVITFDGAPQSGPHADLTSCCDQPAFPNLPTPSSTTTSASCTTSSSTTPIPPATPTTTTSAPGTATSSSSDCTPSTSLPPGTNPGGGQVGLLLISRYVKPDSLDQVDTFNHFSLLKSVEDLFGLTPLGYARDSALPVFDSAIFNAAQH